MPWLQQPHRMTLRSEISSLSEPVPLGSQPQSTLHQNASMFWSWKRRLPADRLAPVPRLRTTSDFPPDYQDRSSPTEPLHKPRSLGARIMVARSVECLNCDQRPYRVTLDDGHEIPTRTIVLATGAQYNKPILPKLESFSGKGIYYNATFMEAQVCADERVIVIGGGNSSRASGSFSSSEHSRRNDAGAVEQLGNYHVPLSHPENRREPADSGALL